MHQSQGDSWGQGAEQSSLPLWGWYFMCSPFFPRISVKEAWDCSENTRVCGSPSSILNTQGTSWNFMKQSGWRRTESCLDSPSSCLLLENQFPFESEGQILFVFSISGAQLYSSWNLPSLLQERVAEKEKIVHQSLETSLARTSIFFFSFLRTPSIFCLSDQYFICHQWLRLPLATALLNQIISHTFSF